MESQPDNIVKKQCKKMTSGYNNTNFSDKIYTFVAYFRFI